MQEKDTYNKQGIAMDGDCYAGTALASTYLVRLLKRNKKKRT